MKLGTGIAVASVWAAVAAIIVFGAGTDDLVWIALAATFFLTL